MKSEEVDKAMLDQYVLGELSKAEECGIEQLAVTDPIVREWIERRREALQDMVWRGQVAPRTDLRQRVLSAMGTELRVERESGRPPIMHQGSTPDEFAPWVNNADHFLPSEAEGFHLIELDGSEDRQTGLVWLKHGYPSEVHTDCVERIMILEGTCTVHLGDVQVPLVSGDVFTIPMYVDHNVEVTGQCWCKAIVQRVAA